MIQNIPVTDDNLANALQRQYPNLTVDGVAGYVAAPWKKTGGPFYPTGGQIVTYP